MSDTDCMRHVQNIICWKQYNFVKFFSIVLKAPGKYAEETSPQCSETQQPYFVFCICNCICICIEVKAPCKDAEETFPY